VASSSSGVVEETVRGAAAAGGGVPGPIPHLPLLGQIHPVAAVEDATTNGTAVVGVRSNAAEHPPATVVATGMMTERTMVHLLRKVAPHWIPAVKRGGVCHDLLPLGVVAERKVAAVTVEADHGLCLDHRMGPLPVKEATIAEVLDLAESHPTHRPLTRKGSRLREGTRKRGLDPPHIPLQNLGRKRLPGGVVVARTVAMTGNAAVVWISDMME